MSRMILMFAATGVDKGVAEAPRSRKLLNHPPVSSLRPLAYSDNAELEKQDFAQYPLSAETRHANPISAYERKFYSRSHPYSTIPT